MGMNQVEKSQPFKTSKLIFHTCGFFYAVNDFFFFFINRSRKFFKLFKSLLINECTDIQQQLSSYQLSHLKLWRNRDEMSSGELHIWSSSRSEDRSSLALSKQASAPSSFLISCVLSSQSGSSQPGAETHSRRADEQIKHQTPDRMWPPRRPEVSHLQHPRCVLRLWPLLSEQSTNENIQQAGPPCLLDVEVESLFLLRRGLEEVCLRLDRAEALFVKETGSCCGGGEDREAPRKRSRCSGSEAEPGLKSWHVWWHDEYFCCWQKHWPVPLSAETGLPNQSELLGTVGCLPAPPNWDCQNYLCWEWKLHLPVFHDHLLVNEFMKKVPQSSFCCSRAFSLKRAAVERDYAQVSPSGPARLTCCSCCWSSVWALRSAGSTGAGHHQPPETFISSFSMFRSKR